MPDESAIGFRFKEYLETKGLSGNEAGRLIGTSGAQVSNILKGENFSIKILNNIFNAFPDLNPSWLLEGSGKMTREKTSEADKSDENIEDKNAHLNAHPDAHLRQKKPPQGQHENVAHEPQSPYNVRARVACEICHANERVIAALQAHINSLERELQYQKTINDELQGREQSGQKRKVG